MWNVSEIFSLTGAAFNYSSYQQPRRGRGSDSNTFSIAKTISCGMKVAGLLYVLVFVN